ncbi:hypothetical protein JHJ32_13865 [Parapedobacter sp. ISTM3]|uniref:hypothetical protein n=1 Tax=Parapedobacter sp. ISTM3 TaxID=2800130 RepID=UPI0019034385|nr:hypothetical protein [Parapedobacter sp. ISTM3]MBK1441082.1 hypothetical protein [Parapedobacter sp. ISTM3]
MLAAIEQLELSGSEPAFLYYLNYYPLLQMSVGVIVQHAERLFGGWHGDILVFPADARWLIFQSLEEIWYAGLRRP